MLVLNPELPKLYNPYTLTVPHRVQAVAGRGESVVLPDPWLLSGVRRVRCGSRLPRFRNSTLLPFLFGGLRIIAEDYEKGYPYYC